MPRTLNVLVPCAQIDELKCSLVITTGGTGPAKRDVTPEATEAVCSKMMPGFGEQMRAISLKYVPTAILSRQTAGIRGEALVINLPGKPKSIRETLDEVFAAVPYCIDLIGGPYIVTNEEVVASFRPPKDRRPPKDHTSEESRQLGPRYLTNRM
jgi:molybdopterin adenylyltransferase